MAYEHSPAAPLDHPAMDSVPHLVLSPFHNIPYLILHSTLSTVEGKSTGEDQKRDYSSPVYALEEDMGHQLLIGVFKGIGGD